MVQSGSGGGGCWWAVPGTGPVPFEKLRKAIGCRTNLLRLNSEMYPNYYLYHCTKTLDFPATFIVSEDLLGALFGQLVLGQLVETGQGDFLGSLGQGTSRLKFWAEGKFWNFRTWVLQVLHIDNWWSDIHIIYDLSLSLSPPASPPSVRKCFTELLWTASITETHRPKEAGSHRLQLLREILGEEVAVEEWCWISWRREWKRGLTLRRCDMATQRYKICIDMQRSRGPGGKLTSSSVWLTPKSRGDIR